MGDLRTTARAVAVEGRSAVRQAWLITQCVFLEYAARLRHMTQLRLTPALRRPNMAALGRSYTAPLRLSDSRVPHVTSGAGSETG